jgi:uncharacterized protein (TIGR02594 family)
VLESILAVLRSLLRRPRGAAAPRHAEPRWLTLARQEIGFHEIGVNRGIERFIEAAHCGALGDPWCAIFVNACLERAGVPGTRSAMARSFEHDPHFVELHGPALGCVVTMWRGSRSSGNGHVFFYTSEDDEGIWGVAGNEDDGVREAVHGRARITGYFWPKSIPLPKVGPVFINGAGSRISNKED